MFKISFDKINRLDYLLICLFLIALFLPISCIDYDKISRVENRVLREFPDYRLSSGEPNFSFLLQFNEWFNDHYGFRNSLIKSNQVLHVKLLKASPTDRVLLGKDDWLFYGDRKDGDPVACYQNTNLFEKDRLEQITSQIIDLDNELKQQGIDFILVIAPNKETVYSEYYPEGINKIGNYSRIDQFIDKVRMKSDMDVVDVRKVLNSTKEKNRNDILYYKTDTHWNNLGAFLAYEEIMKVVIKSHPNVIADNLDTYQIEKAKGGGGDLANMLNLTTSYEDFNYEFNRKGGNLFKSVVENNIPIDATEIENSPLPTVLFTGDSFLGALKQFISNSFSRVEYGKGLASGGQSIASGAEASKGRKPDIYIYEVVERYLDRM